MRRGKRRVLRAHPRVSILKPLAGGDDELAENLDSFARIEYPDYELLFGVASIDDGALPVARDFLRRHPFVGYGVRLSLVPIENRNVHAPLGGSARRRRSTAAG